MNERDSLQVAEMLQEKGYLITAEQAEADVILINTCSVRDQAEQKALNKMGAKISVENQKSKMDSSITVLTMVFLYIPFRFII